MPVRRPVQLSIDMDPVDKTDEVLLSNFALFDAYYHARIRANRAPSLITLARERSQWNALCKHFVAERVSAADATEAHFRKFFAKPERMENHIRNHVSYLRLFDNVMRANARESRVQPSADDLGVLEWNQTARTMMDSTEYLYADTTANKQASVFLTEADDRKLRNYLHAIPEQGTVIELRTFVYMALMRGSGATPGEIRTLQLDEIDVDANGKVLRLRMFGRGGSPGKIYTLEDYAERALSFWLNWNQAHTSVATRGFPVVDHPVEAKRVQFVFPNLQTNARGRYGHAIDSDTCTLCVKEALHALGFNVEGSVTQMLRTQFGTSMLWHGADESDVIERMGLYDRRSLRAYSEIARGQRGTGMRFNARTEHAVDPARTRRRPHSPRPG